MSSIRPKKSLTVLDLLAIVREIREKIVNKYIDKIYRIDNGLLIRIRSDIEKIYIVFTKHRVGITKYVPEGEELRRRDPILKNLVERCRIEGIYMPRIDRIINLKLSSGYELVFELIEPTNIVLKDQEDRIRWCLHRYESKDRKISVGLKYVQPPRNFLDVLNCSIEAYISHIESDKTKDAVRKISRILGVPAEVVKEAITRLDISSEERLGKEDYIKILYEIRRIFNEVLSGNLRPRIYLDSSTNIYISVTPIPFKMYDLTYKYIEFENFNEAVDEYFRKIELLEYERGKVLSIENELEKIEKNIKDVEKSIREYLKKSEELYNKANLVLQNKHSIEKLLEIVNKLWIESRDTFEEEVKGIVIDNVKVIQYVPSEKSLIISIGEVAVKIPIRGNLKDTINEMFNKAKELKKKAENAKKALEQLHLRKIELEKKISETLIKVEESISRIEYGVSEWFEKFKWFITTNEKLVLAGKDASQNEVLVRKYLRENDVFVHADIPGGAVVVIRCRLDEVSEDDIVQAAKYAASNSRAWILGLSGIDVFYVEGRQVSKEAPPGQYLAKGSFMIYGERNWIRNVRLELCIGIRVDSIDNRKVVRIISAPPEAIRRLAEYYILIRPGRLDKNKCSNVIRDKLMKYLKERYNVCVKLRPEDIMIHIPGSSDIVEEFESNDILDWNTIKALAK